jgi:hypothetical protein
MSLSKIGLNQLFVLVSHDVSMTYHVLTHIRQVITGPVVLEIFGPALEPGMLDENACIQDIYVDTSVCFRLIPAVIDISTLLGVIALLALSR